MHSSTIHWFADHISPTQSCVHAVESWVHRERSEFQTIEIFDTRGMGRCLVLDGEVQSFEVDEAVYHEALVLPIGVLHHSPRRGLVIGGGEGATLRESLRIHSLEEIVMVEIDPAMVATSRKYLNSWHDGSFDDPRVRLVCAEGRSFLEECEETYDLIWVDISNPRVGGPARRLFTREFYEVVRSRLAPGGLLALQADTANLLSLETFPRIVRTLEQVFENVRPYVTYVPSFCTLWGFVLCGDLQDPALLPQCEPHSAAVGLRIEPHEIDRRIVDRIVGEPIHYDGQAHCRMFMLPKTLREKIDRKDFPISTDEDPIQELFPGQILSA